MGPYGSYQFIAYGGGEIYRDVFIAVAQLAGQSVLQSMFEVVLMLGLALGILRAAFDFKVGNLMTWLFTAMVIYGIVWIPRVSVNITDKFNQGFYVPVPNVPLGVAFVSTLTSEVGDAAIQMTETAFQDPGGLAYGDSGMIYGAKILSSLTGVRAIDPNLAQSIHAYMYDCVAQDILTNSISLQTIETTGDLWGYLSSNANPALSTTNYAPGTSGATVVTPMTCPQAATAITNALTPEIQLQISRMQSDLNPSQGSTVNPTLLQTAGDSLASGSLGTTSTTTSMLTQALMTTALAQSAADYGAASPGSNVAASLGSIQGQIQENANSFQLGVTAQRAIPVLQIVMTVLFIGMFPLMAPAFLLPGTGVTMLRGYFGGFLYLQLWGPMYVILNKVFLYQTLEGAHAQATIFTGTGNVTNLAFGNVAAVSGLGQELSNIAGVMMLSIPVIAGALTKGAMDAGGHAFQFLAAARSGAEAAGSIEATRNLSLGQTALDNTQWDNVTSRQVNTRPSDTRGAAIDYDYNTLGQATISTGGGPQHGGATYFQAPGNVVPFKVSKTEVLDSALSRSISDAQARSETIRNVWSQGEQLGRQHVHEIFSNHSQGRGWTDSQGNEARDSESRQAQELESVSQRFAMNQGISAEKARALIVEAYMKGEVGLSTPIAKVAGSVGGGVTGSVSERASRTRGANQDLAAAFSHDFTKRQEGLTAQYASRVATETRDESSGSRSVSASTFSSSRSVNAELQRSQETVQRLQSERSAVRRQGIGFDQDLTTQFSNFLASNPILEDGHPVRPWDVIQPATSPDPARYLAYQRAAYERFSASYAADWEKSVPQAFPTMGGAPIRNPGEFSLPGAETASATSKLERVSAPANSQGARRIATPYNGDSIVRPAGFELGLFGRKPLGQGPSEGNLGTEARKIEGSVDSLTK